MRITKKADDTDMNIKKINVHIVSEGNSVSIAEETARLLRLDRSLGSFGSIKHEKKRK